MVIRASGKKWLAPFENELWQQAEVGIEAEELLRRGWRLRGLHEAHEAVIVIPGK